MVASNNKHALWPLSLRVARGSPYKLAMLTAMCTVAVGQEGVSAGPGAVFRMAWLWTGLGWFIHTALSSSSRLAWGARVPERVEAEGLLRPRFGPEPANFLCVLFFFF